MLRGKSEIHDEERAIAASGHGGFQDMARAAPALRRRREETIMSGLSSAVSHAPHSMTRPPNCCARASARSRERFMTKSERCRDREGWRRPVR